MENTSKNIEPIDAPQKKDATSIAVVVLAIIALAILFFGIFGLKNALPRDQAGLGATPAMSEPADTSSAASIPAEIDTAIRNNVTGFGMHLKNVSLLAPAATVRSTMAKEYGPYIIPELLTKWQNDPSQALGKTTSSPWPERIQISTITKELNGTYKVEATVIEMMSNEKPG